MSEMVHQAPPGGVGSEPEEPDAGRFAKAYPWFKDYAPPVIGLAMFLLAVWVLHHALQKVTYAELSDEIAALSGWQILAALAFTALSFAALAGYEQCALRFVGRRLSWARAGLVAFVTQSIAHSTGFAAFIGTGLRYRNYVGDGLDFADVVKVQVFFSSTFILGIMVLSGLALSLEPEAAASVIALPLMAWRGIGLVLLLAVAFYFVLSVTGRFTELRWRRFQMSLPPAGLTVLQILLATIDLGAAAAALYVLLPDLGVSFSAFLGMFTAAIIVGVLSHVPGALGVFESLLILMLQPAPEHLAAVVGSLVMFRAIYYILPLLIGALTLGALEWKRSAAPIQQALGIGWRTASPLAPRLFAILTFLGGAVLLFSGALPAEQARLAFLIDIVPDSLVEISHLAGSLIGMALLFLARSLNHRVSQAWLVSVWLLGAGILVSLFKGFDYEEAIFLLILLAGLIASKREFFRNASLFETQLTLRWFLTVAMTLVAAIWLILFAYRHVDYSRDLWWQFELQSDAPRSLRATLGAAVMFAGIGLLLLLRPAVKRPALPGSDELARAQAVIANGSSDADWLALTGDKALLFNEIGDGFIMYGAIGRTFVAMAEPVGPERCWPALIWRFHEEANRHGARTVFYEVPGSALPHFLDLSLSTMKLGETARVDLSTFGLEGKHRANMRHGYNRARKEGAVFEILQPEAVPAAMDQLQAISDSWLTAHNTREKRFSLGAFDPAYVARMPVAVVRVEGEIKAFANLWLAGDKSSCSPDLMRYGRDAPRSGMDFLMIEIMLWAKAAGYRWFDLGMAPLSGLPDHRLAPLGSKLGRLLYRHGAHFYNFEGLRTFKDKFDPVWEPVYLLYPRGALARSLADIAALVAGGWVGVVRK